MPLSTSTDPVDVPVKPGVEYVINSNTGTLGVQSVTREGETDYTFAETAVGDGAANRATYLGPAYKLIITPSASGVFWAVTKVVKS